MIKVDKQQCQLEGDLLTIVSDLSVAIYGILDMTKEQIPRGIVNKMIYTGIETAIKEFDAKISGESSEAVEKTAEEQRMSDVQNMLKGIIGDK